MGLRVLCIGTDLLALNLVENEHNGILVYISFLV